MSTTAWKNSSTIGSVEMLLNSFALRLLNSTVPLMPVIKRMTSPSIMSYFSLSSTFLNNFLIISGNIHVHVGKDENNKFFLLSAPNRNGEYLAEFSLKGKFVCSNSKFQKKKGKLWIYTYPNN